MREASSLDPKWMVDAVWRRRRMIFYAISALSFLTNAAALAKSLELRGILTNAVALAKSLELHGILTSFLHQLLPQLHDIGVLLVQRPVLVMLLNLIMLRMLVTSGVLGGGLAPKQHEGREMQATEVGGGWLDKRVPISYLPAEAQDHDQSLFRSVFKKRRSSALLFGYTEPGGAALNAASPSMEQAVAGTDRNRGVRQASLFTIEPLESNIERPPPMDFGVTQPDMGTAQSDMCDGGHSIDDPQVEASSVPHLGRTPDLFDHVRHPDDYDLDRQEFNERVESFITKFKRNLTMQRQDSFDRLLSLVGGGGKKRQA